MVKIDVRTRKNGMGRFRYFSATEPRSSQPEQNPTEPICTSQDNKITGYNDLEFK